ncbi:DUF362 domain-containing protein [Bacteroidota bacterium]
MKKSGFGLLKRCPKTGKIVGYNADTLFGKILFPLAGILAIAWFLFRVLPKPDRIAYPCQKVAMSVGGTFITYLSALILSYPLFKGIGRIHKKAAYVSIFVLLVIGSTIVILGSNDEPKEFIPDLTSAEGPNNPMGEGKGIFPGRVVWVQDFDATSWVEGNGYWWDDDNTDQAIADKMFEQAILNITGESNSEEAWNKLFEYQNVIKGNGNRGYKKGEKIVFKVNVNPSGRPDQEWNDRGYPSPHMLNSMVKQLIEVAGVNGEDIILAEPSRYFTGPIYNKIRSNPSPEYRDIRFIDRKGKDISNHVGAQPDTNNVIYFNMPDGSKYKMCFPQCFTDADYIIDYSVFRPHSIFGITIAAKNHFGSVWDLTRNEFTPRDLHVFASNNKVAPNKHGDPHCSPVLLGHKTTKDKTMLYFADGLYTAINQGGKVQRFSTMDNEWFSSLLISLDPVALESVCYDFIISENSLVVDNKSFNGNQESQLHESAMAGRPASGTVYDPENDGTALESLGVHEHWNNAKDKLYSRNMGKNHGIELISIKPISGTALN